MRVFIQLETLKFVPVVLLMRWRDRKCLFVAELRREERRNGTPVRADVQSETN